MRAQTNAPVPSSSAWLAVVIAVLAAAALAYASFGRRWIQNSVDDAGFGLRQASWCEPAGCHVTSTEAWADELIRTRSTDGSRPSSGTFVTAGSITSVGAWLAAAMLLLGAAFGALRRPAPGPVAPTTIALLGLVTGLIAGCVFVATKPGNTGDFGVGWTFWVFAGGIVAGVVGCIMLAKASRPAIGDWDPGESPEEEEAPAWDALTPRPGPPPQK